MLEMTVRSSIAILAAGYFRAISNNGEGDEEEEDEEEEDFDLPSLPSSL
jgi:hypothetical protein